MLVAFLLVVLDDCLVFGLVLFTIIFDKPKFARLLNLLKIIKRVTGFFITEAATKIARASQPLRKNRFYDYRTSWFWKDFAACFERPIQRRNQYNIRLILL